MVLAFLICLPIYVKIIVGLCLAKRTSNQSLDRAEYRFQIPVGDVPEAMPSVRLGTLY